MKWNRRSGKLPKAVTAVFDSEDTRFSILVLFSGEFALQILEAPLDEAGEFRLKYFPTFDLAKAFAEDL